jgi:hypothetical protein
MCASRRPKTPSIKGFNIDWQHPEISNRHVRVDYNASDADSKAQLGPFARRRT